LKSTIEHGPQLRQTELNIANVPAATSSPSNDTIIQREQMIAGILFFFSVALRIRTFYVQWKSNGPFERYYYAYFQSARSR
jgi:hypothetical protein